MSATGVTVYTTSTCPWCDRVKDYLGKAGVPFEEKRVDSDYDAAMEMIQRSGQQGVPVIAADNDVIVGFDQPRLARIVDRYGKPKRAPLGLLAADTESYFGNHPEIAATYPDGTRGIFVGEVKVGSVADKAGIRRGDVITSVAGKRVKNMATLDQLIDTLDSGQSVKARYVRPDESDETTFQF
ncbi:MAG: PDZ domain-containing protein [Thermomicrobiales bacterium]|nr:PDZ domain-containing protein [Thermomicrobiales bacterium]MCO5221157.1 PDZ domain-containing protein [Thermomicrobiales bacterium]